MEEPQTDQKTIKSHTRRIPILHLAILVLVLGLALCSFQLYKAHSELKTFKANPQEATDKEVEKLVEEVGKLIDLPTGEKPTLATVKDPQKLKGQAFFEKAQENDKVLIFNNAKLAILYRPTTNKVLNVAPINIGQNESPSTQAAEEVKIIILNGTSVAGLAGKYQDKVKDKISAAKIVSIGNAQQKDIEKTFIVDNTNSKTEQAKEIANNLSISVGVLPQDQIDTDADFTIVVGKDQN